MAHPYLDRLAERVLVFDGAMGTSIQALGLSEADFGGPALEGCNDHVSISRPDAVEAIHASFLDVGCDVIETNTFRSNRFAIEEYGLSERVPELNRTAAEIARRTADAFSSSGRPRFVAGSMGPSGYLPSTSDPVLGAKGWEELAAVFAEQARALIEGGVDLLLVETSQDLLEVKAAVAGIRRALAESGARLPIQAQVTLDPAGRMLLGTDIQAASVTLAALRVDVIGLNCSTGPEPMRQHVRWLCENCPLPVSVIPNAGMPRNVDGVAHYDLSPEALAGALEEFAGRFGVAVVGGCCGTTPDHLRAVVERVGDRPPLRREVRAVPRAASAMTAIDLAQDPPPTLIGERVNSQGSRAVKRLLLRDDYEGILQVARGQIEEGAHLLDVCVALTERPDEAGQMGALVELLSQGVPAPLVIDTTEPEVVRAALERCPGRPVVNSIHLEDGRKRIDAVVPLAVLHGAALVALTIDEDGMAKSAARKLEIARRIHGMCVDEYGMPACDLIFDALTFTLATGDEEFRRSAIETIEGVRAIKAELPGVLTSLGVSNVSFGLRPHARAVLNSVFLHHCVEAGLDMAIVNSAHITPYAEIDAERRALADDLILDRREDALSRFIAFFEEHEEASEGRVDPTAEMSAADAIHWQILHRRREGIDERVALAVGAAGGDHEAAVRVLNGVLLPAMKEVGDKFGAGELILPFVLQSAEVMKRAVAKLETYLDHVEGHSKGTIVLATVFGDVHDIGKNLVGTILANNGYTVHDLGKQVPVNTIIQKAEEVDADAIGLSALLVSTSRQMPLCVQELHARGLGYPVLVGGAAINPSFVRRAAFVGDDGDLYGPGLFYCRDAFEGLAAVEALVDPDRREEFVRARHAEIHEGVERRAALQATVPARPGSANGRTPPAEVPRAGYGIRVLDRLPLIELFERIDLNTLYRLHWGAKNAKGERWARLLAEEFEPRLARYRAAAVAEGLAVRAAFGIWPAAAEGDALVVYDPTATEREIARFAFPRQPDRDRLCLADYFRPSDERERDAVAIQIVTAGDALLERSAALMDSGDYGEGYYLHGFGVRLAEAAAEYVHGLVRREMGIDPERGLRYSWGYGACPDVLQHRIVFDLLPAREALGMDLTAAGALVPELSTAALVVHHPQARYFTV